MAEKDGNLCSFITFQVQLMLCVAWVALFIIVVRIKAFKLAPRHNHDISCVLAPEDDMLGVAVRDLPLIIAVSVYSGKLLNIARCIRADSYRYTPWAH